MLYQYFLPPSAVYSFQGWFAKARWQASQQVQNKRGKGLSQVTSAGLIISSGLVHCVTLVVAL